MQNRMYTCMCNWVTMLYSRKKNCMGEITIKKIIIQKMPKERRVFWNWVMGRLELKVHKIPVNSMLLEIWMLKAIHPFFGVFLIYFFPSFISQLWQNIHNKIYHFNPFLFQYKFFLLYSMVTQLHIHVHILFLHIIMLHHK